MKNIISEIPLNQPLGKIQQIEDTDFATDELCLDRLDLIFPTFQLVVLPVVETDEIEILLQSHQVTELDYRSGRQTPPWAADLLNQTLQMIWVCENQQGYTDQLILAFDTLQPTLGILAEGSVLKPFLMRSLPKQSTSQSGLMNFLDEVQEIQSKVPVEEWEKLPHDASINHDHYLYGAPKIE